jgi:DNA-directed RNA polymerase subunit RPC12/RpoP
MDYRPKIRSAGEPDPGREDQPAAPAPWRAPERVTSTGDRLPCPLCGSRNVAVIQYGLPGPRAFSDPGREAGEFVLGGCIVSAENPFYHCHRCGHEW